MSMYDYGILGASIGVVVAMVIAIYVLFIIAWWKLFEKAGEPGWASLIPFYNTYVLYKIAWGNGLLFLVLFLSILNFVPVLGVIIDIGLFIFNIFTNINLAKSFGQGGGFAVGLIIFPNIFLLILAFGSAQYVGPKGVPQAPYGQAPYGQAPQNFNQNQYGQQNFNQPNQNYGQQNFNGQNQNGQNNTFGGQQ